MLVSTNPSPDCESPMTSVVLLMWLLDSVPVRTCLACMGRMHKGGRMASGDR